MWQTCLNLSFPAPGFQTLGDHRRGLNRITAPQFGGWSGFSAKLAGLDEGFLKVPRVINFGLGGAEGENPWTSAMILTYMFALMGIQSSPAFTMWTFGLKSPKPLAWQQAFMSTFVVGLALFFFTAFQGMTAFGFVMYILLAGVIWGFRFPRVGAALGVLAGLYPGQYGLLLLRLSRLMVLADRLVDSGHHHDVGPVLQGGDVHHQR